MLFATEHTLSEMIVTFLGERRAATALFLHQEINRSLRPCSLQGVYHELRKLQREGVVVKVGETYTLNLSWVFELEEFASSVYENYVKSPSARVVLPASNSSNVWRFSNLLKTDDFWAQLLLVLYRETDQKILFNWIPHPWFYFAQVEKVEQFYRVLEREGRRIYSVIGGDTYLDRRYAEGVSPKVYTYSLKHGPFQGDSSTYLYFIDEYVLTIKLDPLTTKRIDGLFRSIKSPADMDYHRIYNTLDSQARIVVRLRHQPRKAKALIKEYCDFFGISEMG